MTAFVLALLLSQNTPRHPSPATANGVPLGNGTNWVTNVIPGCFGATQSLQFDGGFTCTTLDAGTPVWSVWSSFYPGSASGGAVFMSPLYSPVAHALGGVTCNATAAGVGTAGTLHIYDVTAATDLGTCAMDPVNVTQLGTSCSLALSTTAGHEYLVNYTCTRLSSVCTYPENMGCGVMMRTP